MGFYCDCQSTFFMVSPRGLIFYMEPSDYYDTPINNVLHFIQCEGLIKFQSKGEAQYIIECRSARAGLLWLNSYAFIYSFIWQARIALHVGPVTHLRSKLNGFRYFRIIQFSVVWIWWLSLLALFTIIIVYKSSHIELLLNKVCLRISMKNLSLISDWSLLFKFKVKVKVTLRLKVSKSVSLCVEPHVGLMTRY
jgi:hypothetical protein